MTLMTLVLSLFVACNSDPILNCDQPPEIADCCAQDTECRAFFGGAYPYCYFPGRETGICGECRTNADCPGANDVCTPDTVIGAFCCDENRYYCD